MASKKNNALNLSLGVDLEGFKKGFADAIKTTQGSTASIEKEAQDMAASLVASMKKVENSTTMKQASRNLQNMVGQMHAFGLEGTKAYNEVVKAGGRLKAELDDVQQAIEAARPDAPFKALSNTLGAAAQGFAGVQGAMALFGAESEEVQKTLLKVQAAMAFAEGFKAIDGLSDGFTQLNLIIKANPLIAGVTIFAGAVAVMYALSDSTDEAAKAQKRLSDASEKAFEKTIEERSELEQLLRVYNDKNTTDQERLRIQKELVAKYPEYLGQISTEKVEQDKVNAGVSSYIKLLELKAKAQAFQEMYVEALKKEQKILKDIGSDADIFFSMGMATGGKTARQVEAANVAKELAGIKSQWDEIAIAAQKAEQSQSRAFGNVTSTKTPKAKSATPTIQTKKAVTPSWLLGGQGEFEGVKNQLYFVGIEAKNTAEAVDTLGTSFTQTSFEAMKFADSAEQMRRLVESSVEGLAFSIGDSLGKAMAGEKVSFGNNILLAMADFGEQLGKMMIGIGITIEAFKKSLATLNPIVAVAGGIALVAAAAAVRSKIQNGGEGFASGGLIGGNSFTGDRLLAPVNSGEVVLNTGQQNDLLKMVNSGFGGGGQLTAKVEGKDLLFVLNRTRGGFNRG